jgi:hypothetical protein
MFLQTVLLIGSKKIRALFKGFYKKIHWHFFIILSFEEAKNVMKTKSAKK